MASLLSVASIVLGAYASYLNRDSTNALVGKHLTQFYHYMLIWVAVTAIVCRLAYTSRISGAVCISNGANG